MLMAYEICLSLWFGFNGNLRVIVTAITLMWRGRIANAFTTVYILTLIMIFLMNVLLDLLP